MSAVIGYAPGAYDLFHVGHLNVLRHAREHCDVLVAGVVADEVCELTKGVRPFVPARRAARHRPPASGSSTRCTPRPPPTSSTPGRTCGSTGSSRATTGAAPPRATRSRSGSAAVGVEVVYFPYTVHTSSTMLRRAVSARAVPHPADLAAGAPA